MERARTIDYANLSVQALVDRNNDDGQVFVSVNGNNNHVVVNGEEVFDDRYYSSGEEDDATLDAAAFLLRVLRDGGGGGPHRGRGGRSSRLGAGAPYPPPARRPPTFLTSTGPPRIVPRAQMTRVHAMTDLCTETNHIPDLQFFSIQHPNGDQKIVAVIRGEGKYFIGQLTKLWNYHMTDRNGLYAVWNRILDDPRFAASRGPLMNRMRAELLGLAARISHAAGRGPTLTDVGECSLATNSHKKCSTFRALRCDGTGAYDRALTMAGSIVQYHLPTRPGDQFSVDDIMQYDIYGPFVNSLRDLENRGIISPRSDAVGNPNDLQGAVLLPMFRALDALIPDHQWRNVCAEANVNIKRDERHLIDFNDRIYNEHWD